MIFSARNLSRIILSSTLLTSAACSNAKKKKTARPIAKTQTQPQVPVQPPRQQGPETSQLPPEMQPQAPVTPSESTDHKSPHQPAASTALGIFEAEETQFSLKNLISANMLIKDEKINLILITKNEKSEPSIERFNYSGALESRGTFIPFESQSDKKQSTQVQARCVNSCERILVKLKKPGMGTLHLAFEALGAKAGWAHLAFIPGSIDGPELKSLLKRSQINEEFLSISDSLDTSSGNSQGLYLEVKSWLDMIEKKSDKDNECSILIEDLKKALSSLAIASNELNSAVEELDKIPLMISLSESRETLKGVLAKLERAKLAFEIGSSVLNQDTSVRLERSIAGRGGRVQILSAELAKLLAIINNSMEQIPRAVNRI